MQNDEVIWQVINHQFCSFKSKIARERTFCSNPYSVSGLCIRSACPLANSNYATIREEEGVCYLMMKTIERAHTPRNLWEKIQLPSNYVKALEIVSTRLEHFPKYLVHRNKQRLTKIHQMLIRMRKLKLKTRYIVCKVQYSTWYSTALQYTVQHDTAVYSATVFVLLYCTAPVLYTVV
jgi:protein MAK16